MRIDGYILVGVVVLYLAMFRYDPVFALHFVLGVIFGVSMILVKKQKWT